MDPLTNRLYHGGVPGLRVGDEVIGGQARQQHAGCPICAARANGTATIDPATEHPDHVYATTDREYARFYASLYGYGDLYRVEVISGVPWEVSTEDHFPTIRAPRLRVAGIVDRAVLLTWQQRRRLWRRWETADHLAAVTP